MTWTDKLKIIGLCSLGLFVGGCSKGVAYTGSIGDLTPESRSQVQAYQAFMRQRAKGANKEGEVDANTSAPNLSAADMAKASNQSATTAQFEDTQTLQSASKHVRRQRPMDVFGTVAESPRSRKGELDGGADNISRVSFASEGGDFDPVLDPTGQWMAFASTRHRETSDIYIKSTTGSTVTQITNDPNDDVMPVFSPDGKSIAFASNRSGNWDIYIVNIAGGQPIQLTHDPMHEIHPSFSPDGKTLVYSMYGDQSGQWEMVMINVDNPTTRRFIGYGLFPNWSPQGNTIVYQKARQRGTRWFSIWTVEMINGEAMRPTEILASANSAVITPSWSPDGQYVTFCTVVNPDKEKSNKPAQADVWVAKIDGTGRANLTHSHYANLQPRWSSDGTIYFVSNRSKGGIENVWAIRPDRVMRLAQQMRDNAVRTAQQTNQSNRPTIVGKENKQGAVDGESSAMVPVHE